MGPGVTQSVGTSPTDRRSSVQKVSGRVSFLPPASRFSFLPGMAPSGVAGRIKVLLVSYDEACTLIYEFSNSRGSALACFRGT